MTSTSPHAAAHSRQARARAHHQFAAYSPRQSDAFIKISGPELRPVACSLQCTHPRLLVANVEAAAVGTNMCLVAATIAGILDNHYFPPRMRKRADKLQAINEYSGHDGNAHKLTS